jgi:hypothetical protein
MKPESPDAGRLLSSKPVSPQEAADRLAIRELLEAYSHCADRRDARGQMALFTTDTHLMVYMNAKDLKPLQELPWREALAQAPRSNARKAKRARSFGCFILLPFGPSRTPPLMTAGRGTETFSRPRPVLPSKADVAIVAA